MQFHKPLHGMKIDSFSAQAFKMFAQVRLIANEKIAIDLSIGRKNLLNVLNRDYLLL